jgi:hypothetical protein
MQIDPLDAVLDDALTLLQRGEVVHDILGRHPAYSDQLRPLLETAVTVRQASAVPFARRGAIRTRLSQAAHSHSTVPAAYVWLAQRVFKRATPLAVMKVAQAILVALVLLAAGTIGVVAAANDSAPGDLLYPVKRASEQVWMGIRNNLDTQRHSRPSPTVTLEPARTHMPARTPSTAPTPIGTPRAMSTPSPVPESSDLGRTPPPVQRPDATPMPALTPAVTRTMRYIPTWMPTWPPHLTPIPTWPPLTRPPVATPHWTPRPVVPPHWTPPPLPRPTGRPGPVWPPIVTPKH